MEQDLTSRCSSGIHEIPTSKLSGFESLFNQFKPGQSYFDQLKNTKDGSHDE